ncbi:hypothetical protein LSUE1_G001006 [Lachnellula suecica]|uniref:Cyclase n=1 Tax=Lachnellula suecica TaxID=602035 RepID=A0A8T9CFF3_9HELO|nr:hypothetical protein LSUE1_G001006 [Lachnellula suecica]
MAKDTPPFSSLPLQKDGPRGNAWGLFGKNDELGMLNRPSMMILWPLIHSPRHNGMDSGILVYFNGCKQEDVHNSKRNGIHVWVENGGVVGRGVLLDYCSWAESEGKLLPALETSSITVSDLEKVAEFQGVIFKPGDILFVRSGFVRALDEMTKDEAVEYASLAGPPNAIGVKSCEETLKWIWEKKFSAVAGDALAFESLPFQSTTHWLHEWLLAGWGLPIGELFDLEKLAAECKHRKKWNFFFSSMPLNVPGGVASPPNGVAIL